MQGQTPNLKGHREGPLEAICSQKKSSSALEANGTRDARQRARRMFSEPRVYVSRV